MRRDFNTVIRLIAYEEWRSMWRKRVALSAFLLFLLLTLVATLVSYQQKAAAEAERAHFQATADEHWHAQPDRHPHRVVHYGHFVFRPLEPLAFFDFGVDPYTGQAIYLEGHRQNSANFSDARQSSLLLRFGQLTPAFVLQTLVPLVIVFLAFGSIAREREQGQLRLVLSQGISGKALLTGKALGHAVVALLLAAPAFGALMLAGLSAEGDMLRSALMAAGYALYLLVWVLVAVAVSASLSRARDALLVLVSLWIALVILVPRVLPAVASSQIALPTRIETEVAIKQDLLRIGDSHNPNDPHFNDFRQRVLKAYGVSRVEDLPVNYRGLLMEEGERMTSELFDSYMQKEFALQREQAALVNSFAAVSPFIAIRRLSMALAGTDLESHQRFLLDAESYRFNLIQALNGLHAKEVKYENDREQRISRDLWDDLPRFEYSRPDWSSLMQSHVLPGLGMLAAWLLGVVLVLRRIAGRLERTVK